MPATHLARTAQCTMDMPPTEQSKGAAVEAEEEDASGPCVLLASRLAGACDLQWAAHSVFEQVQISRLRAPSPTQPFAAPAVLTGEVLTVLLCSLCACQLPSLSVYRPKHQARLHSFIHSVLVLSCHSHTTRPSNVSALQLSPTTLPLPSPFLVSRAFATNPWSPLCAPPHTFATRVPYTKPTLSCVDTKSVACSMQPPC